MHDFWSAYFYLHFYIVNTAKLSENVWKEAEKMLEQIQKYPQKEEYQKLVEADRINLYEREAEKLVDDSIVVIEGHIQQSDVEEPKILVDKINPIKEPSSNKLYISLEDSNDKNLIETMKLILSKYKGNSPVIFYFMNNKKAFGLEERYWIDAKRVDDLKIDLLNYLDNDPDRIVLK